MAVPQFINTPRETLSTLQIMRLARDARVVVFTLSDGRTINDPYGSEAEAQTALEEYLVLLEAMTPEGLGYMQPMYGDADTPTDNPPLLSKPAFYRGRTNNTFWMWDTEEQAWWPVITV